MKTKPFSSPALRPSRTKSAGTLVVRTASCLLIVASVSCGDKSSPSPTRPSSSPPPSCTFAVHPATVSLPAAGGTISLDVTTTAGCAWSVVNNVTWISITAGQSGTGSGSVQLLVSPNTASARNAAITVAAQNVTVQQQAVGALTNPCAGPPSAQSPDPIPGVVVQMLGQVESQISSALNSLTTNLPRNTQWTTQYEAKIAMLRNESLARQIVDGRMYAAEGLSSRTPVIAVFPAEYMRSEAARAVHDVTLALPVLENFMAAPYALNHIYLWYGFQLGSSGGVGAMMMEDQSCYEGRLATGLQTGYPYEAMLDHEVSHGYLAHESSTQFLEVYTHNLVHVGSPDFSSWTYVRSYDGVKPSNTGINALLDIYQMLGHERMAEAFRKLSLVYAPYGQVLSPAAQQVFVDVAPDSLKTQVAAKAAQIGY